MRQKTMNVDACDDCLFTSGKASITGSTAVYTAGTFSYWGCWWTCHAKFFVHEWMLNSSRTQLTNIKAVEVGVWISFYTIWAQKKDFEIYSHHLFSDYCNKDKKQGQLCEQWFFLSKPAWALSSELMPSVGQSHRYTCLLTCGWVCVCGWVWGGERP